MFELIETETKETAMNIATISDTTTMTSREIADLTGKQHKDVLYDIRKMLDELGKTSADFSADLPDSYGRPQPGFALPMREALILTSGYSVKQRAAIIDRWHELEQQAALARFNVPTTYPEAMRLAADLADQKAKVEAQLALAAPKAEALDRIATQTEGAVNLRIAAKLLQVPEKQFLQFANAKGFIFRNHFSHTWQGYADKAKAGLVELKLTTVERDDGSSKTVEQVLITRPGLTKLAQMLGVSMPHNNNQAGMSA